MSPRTEMFPGPWHNWRTSLARLPSLGKGSLPGTATGPPETGTGGFVQGPPHEALVVTVQPDPVQWKSDASPAGTLTPPAVKAEAEVTMTSLPAFSVRATVTGVLSLNAADVPTVVTPPAERAP